jgi:DNA-binding beta-propeller fold protein YncE
LNNTVLKLSPSGHVLPVLGRRNTGGEGHWVFNNPADVAFSRDGDVYVADGYGNSRIVKFDRDGNFTTAWGSYGTGPGQFNPPRAVIVDRTGRVIVGDRANGRIQMFSGDGTFQEEWKNIGYPYGLALTTDGHIWMADGGFDRVVERDPNGKILGAIGSPGHLPGQFAWAHFLAVSNDHKIFVADVLNWRFQVFGPTTPTGGPTDYVPTVRQFWDYTKSKGFAFHDQPGLPKR